MLCSSFSLRYGQNGGRGRLIEMKSFLLLFWPVPGVQIVERGRKIREEKKNNEGRLEGERGRERL